MLAYTIWHWPRPAVEVQAYAAHQRYFHEELGSDPAPGFRWSQSVRVTCLPWANGGGLAFQDRFVVEDWSAFEGLEPHAISGARQAPHGRMTSGVEKLVAGIYGLRLGMPTAVPRWSHWFARPAGMSYDEMDALLAPFTDLGAALWGRRLALGPTPEFCLESAGRIDVPRDLQPLSVALEPAWPA